MFPIYVHVALVLVTRCQDLYFVPRVAPGKNTRERERDKESAGCIYYPLVQPFLTTFTSCFLVLQGLLLPKRLFACSCRTRRIHLG